MQPTELLDQKSRTRWLRKGQTFSRCANMYVQFCNCWISKAGRFEECRRGAWVLPISGGVLERRWGLTRLAFGPSVRNRTLLAHGAKVADQPSRVVDDRSVRQTRLRRESTVSWLALVLRRLALPWSQETRPEFESPSRVPACSSPIQPGTFLIPTTLAPKQCVVMKHTA
jgi:hypothetical protein